MESYKVNRAIQRLKGEDTRVCIDMLIKQFGSMDFVPFKKEQHDFWLNYYAENCMCCTRNISDKRYCCHFCYLLRGWLFFEKIQG